MATRKGAAVKFGTPPPQRAQRYDWDKVAAELRKNPGKPNDNEGWGLVFEGDKSSLVVAIRQGSIRAFRGGGFEIRTANNTKEYPRTCDLWMRFVPENEEN